MVFCHNKSPGNTRGDCHETEPSKLEDQYSSYAIFTWVFLLSLLGYVFIVVTASFSFDLFWNHTPPRSVTGSLTLPDDEKYALGSIGEDSVYQYFLGNSVFNWMIALAVITFQALALAMFVRAAGKDFGSDRSDFVYSQVLFGSPASMPRTALILYLPTHINQLEMPSKQS